MMKALMLDDEVAGREDLRKLLSQHKDVDVVAEAADVATALKLTEKLQPDLAFLDVRLRGETAFDYVGQLRSHPPKLIFVTAHDSYAVRGFECNALDYLLKPVLAARLAESLNRIRRKESLERQVAETDDSVFLRFENTARLVPWSQINTIQTHGNYTQVNLHNGDSTLILRTLKEWNTYVPKNMFVQAHRTTLVRVQAIRSVEFKQRQRCLLIDSGITVPVSRSCWPDVRAAIIDWHPEVGGCL